LFVSIVHKNIRNNWLHSLTLFYQLKRDNSMIHCYGATSLLLYFSNKIDTFHVTRGGSIFWRGYILLIIKSRRWGKQKVDQKIHMKLKEKPNNIQWYKSDSVIICLGKIYQLNFFFMNTSIIKHYHFKHVIDTVLW